MEKITIRYIDPISRVLVKVVLEGEEAKNFNENEFQRKNGMIFSIER